jgi:hypothetical protein
VALYVLTAGEEKKVYEQRETNVERETYDYIANNLSHQNNKRSLKKNLEAMPEKHSKDSLQKTSVLGTSHTIRKALKLEA